MVTLALATLVVAGDGPVDAGVVACATVAALLFASNRLPPIPKKDATLSPASRMRLPFAGCLRRARWQRRRLSGRRCSHRDTGPRRCSTWLPRGGPAFLESPDPLRLLDVVRGLSHRTRSSCPLRSEIGALVRRSGARARRATWRPVPTRQSAAGDADGTAGTGVGDDAVEEPSAPEEAPTANSTETTLIVIALAVAIAASPSIVCSPLRVPGETGFSCHSMQQKPDEGPSDAPNEASVKAPARPMHGRLSALPSRSVPDPTKRRVSSPTTRTGSAASCGAISRPKASRSPRRRDGEKPSRRT